MSEPYWAGLTPPYRTIVADPPWPIPWPSSPPVSPVSTHLAIQIAKEVHRQHGARWSKAERDSAIEAAAIGLAMQWVDPATGEVIDR